MTNAEQGNRRPDWRHLRWPALACIGALVAVALASTPSRQCVRQQTLIYSRTTHALVLERAEAAAEVYCSRHGNRAMRGEPKFYRVPARS